MKSKFSDKVRKFFNWIFPNDSACISCGRDLFVPSPRYGLCEQCAERIKPITMHCLKCGKPTQYGEYCSVCTKEHIYFERNYSCYYYKDVIKDVMLAFKFKNKQYFAPFITSFYVDKIIEENIEFDVITAVPMTKVHRRERGYNQCDLIARELSKRLNVPYNSGLYKKPGRGRQLGKSFAERKKNAENAYFTMNDSFKGLRVLVIDDVYTTGSTMNNAAKALLKGKAKSVIGLTLCNVEFGIGTIRNPFTERTKIKE